MNTTTLNMTTLDGGNVIIKKGEGGGATINNQDKVVDITENGTTEVVADGGYTGLGKVTINTEVSGGESGGIKLMYLDVEKLGVESAGISIYTCMVRGIVNMGQEMKAALPTSMFQYYEGHDADAFAIMPDAKVVMAGRTATLKESLQLMGVWDACVNAEITEEQFYTLD